MNHILDIARADQALADYRAEWGMQVTVIDRRDDLTTAKHSPPTPIPLTPEGRASKLRGFRATGYRLQADRHRQSDHCREENGKNIRSDAFNEESLGTY
jgi:hypothetical protein